MKFDLAEFRLGRKRRGKVLVLLALLLPSALGIVGLVIDGGLMMVEHRKAQHAADAAATASAMALYREQGPATATTVAREVVQEGHGLAGASVAVSIPPATGRYAGEEGYVEIVVTSTYDPRFLKISGILSREVQGRAVAGAVPAPVGAAIVVLDPTPEPLDIDNLVGDVEELDPLPLSNAAATQSGVMPFVGSLPIVGPLVVQLLEPTLNNLLSTEITQAAEDVVQSLPVGPPPSLLAGLEVEGLGCLQVDGAIYVNSEWGQVDQTGKLIGSCPGPPYALACMPLLPLTRVQARDIRVVGGVDNESLYGPFDAGESSPLQAGRLPVPDPFQSLPVPSETSDPNNMSDTLHNPSDAVRVALPLSKVNGLLSGLLAAVPLLGPHRDHLRTLLTEPTLTPGVYDSLTVISPLGGARLEPGVYIIRGTNPHTKLSLCLIGPVQAEGVLFYITESATFDVATGLPDASQSGDAPRRTVGTLLPSVLIAPLLAGGRISGLDAPGSPFDNMLIFQQRQDRRPIIIEAQHLLGGGALSGTIYAKWSHLLFVAGAGSYDLRFVTGTLRLVTVTNTVIAPRQLLPAAKDILLVE